MYCPVVCNLPSCFMHLVSIFGTKPFCIKCNIAGSISFSRNDCSKKILSIWMRCGYLGFILHLDHKIAPLVPCYSHWPLHLAIVHVVFSWMCPSFSTQQNLLSLQASSAVVPFLEKGYSLQVILALHPRHHCDLGRQPEMGTACVCVVQFHSPLIPHLDCVKVWNMLQRHLSHAFFHKWCLFSKLYHLDSKPSGFTQWHSTLS